MIDTLPQRENYRDEINEIARKCDWRKVLDLSQKYGFNITHEFMWCYPTVQCTELLKQLWQKLNIKTILSVGCGSGLMELILREAIGVKISGLEVDKDWWMRHKPFIPMNYLDESNQKINSQLLLDSSQFHNWNFALMFCYFNCRPAFNQYVEAYRGNWIIIIGPADRTGRYTEPLPLDAEFSKNKNFKLVFFTEFGDNHDIMAIYERDIDNIIF